MILKLLILLPIALASPLVGRQALNATEPSSNTTSSTPPASASNSTQSAANPTVTIYPAGSDNKPITVEGLAFPQFGQDVYLGIPFAQPPIGNFRFVAPQQAIYKSSKIMAQTQSPACLQGPNSLLGEYGESEDCLNLNVFTPAGANAKTAYLPVMVWVYGGSFLHGTASTYNATAFLGQGIVTGKPVIFVALNYRLGIFGFGEGAEFAANKGANLGIRDVTAGLQWVQQNIWAFGGNPEKVTVFGESAGAILIANLFLDPNQKLFRSAIMESGAQATAPLGPTATTWQAVYDLVVQFSNCSQSNATTAAANQSTYDCLKSLPSQALLDAQLAVLNLTIYSGAFAFGPSIDGDVIPASPHTLLAEGKFANIPFISGNNLDEGTLFTPQIVNGTAELDFALSLAEPHPANMSIDAKLEMFYPDVPSVGSPYGSGNQTFGLPSTFKQFASILGDTAFQSNRRFFLEQANKHGNSKTWSYLFTEYTPGAPPYLGSFHGSEVQFVYGVPGTMPQTFSASAIGLSESMINYWLNFAYYTDPSGGSNGNVTKWPDYGTSKNMLQLNGTNTTVIQDTYREKQISFILSEPVAFDARR